REAEIWLAASADKKVAPTDLHIAYIHASRQAAIRQRNRLIAAGSAAVVISLLLAALALNRSQVADANAATSVANAQIAENNLTTAVAAQATSDRRADEAQSLSWAANAKERNAIGDPVTGLSLAIQANRIPNPPFLAQQSLADIAYAPGAMRQFKGYG